MRNSVRRTKRIGFLAFDGLTALDLTGPADAFAAASAHQFAQSGAPAYEIFVIGLGHRPARTESGVVIKPDTTLARAPKLHTLVVPGGSGLREPSTNQRILKWIRDHVEEFERVVSICTGIYGLAASGLLDGRRVTTHWQFARDVRARFPKLRVDANALFVRDGKFYTSAGVTAGIDLALALIEDDLGPRAALAAARELVMYVKRPGGQEQYSAPLKYQTESLTRFSDLIGWLSGHFHESFTIEELATRAGMSERNFSRQFRKATKMSPRAFVEDLRLNESKNRLAAKGRSIEEIADSLGFTSGDVFRRAFLRHFGIGPLEFRRRFIR